MSKLIEPYPIPDIWVNGLDHVEDMGDGIFRLVYFTTQKVGPAGVVDRVVSAKLVWPLHGIAASIPIAASAIGTRAFSEITKPSKRDGSG